MSLVHGVHIRNSSMASSSSSLLAWPPLVGPRLWDFIASRLVRTVVRGANLAYSGQSDITGSVCAGAGEGWIKLAGSDVSAMISSQIQSINIAMQPQGPK